MSGDINHDIQEIVAQLLIDLAQGSDVEMADDWPVYESKMPDSPDNAICIYNSEGFLGGRSQPDGQTQEKYGIQIKVRSKLLDGYVKLKHIGSTFDQQLVPMSVIIDTDEYTITSMKRMSSIIPLGMDATSRRSTWVLNFLASITRTIGSDI